MAWVVNCHQIPRWVPAPSAEALGLTLLRCGNDSSHESSHLKLEDGLSIAFYFITLGTIVFHLMDSHNTQLRDHSLQSPHPFIPISKFIFNKKKCDG